MKNNNKKSTRSINKKLFNFNKKQKKTEKLFNQIVNKNIIDKKSYNLIDN